MGVRIFLLLLLLVVALKQNVKAQDEVAKIDTTQSKDFFAMRWAEAILDFTSIEREKYSVKLYPVAGYEPQTGVIVGVKPIVAIYNSSGNTTTITSEISFSTDGQLKTKFDINAYTRSKWNIVAQGEYLGRTDDWFGIGLDDNPDELFSYDYSNIGLTGTLSKGVGKVFLGLAYDVSNISITKPDDAFFDNALKETDGSFLVGIGPLLRFDNRDNVIFPTSGNFLELTSRFYSKLLGNENTFSTIDLDYRHFWHIKGDRNVIGFQTKAAWTTENAPFYRMPILADKDNLRGISNPNKYIDHNMWYVQTEYRRHLWWRVNVNAWVGAGNIFHDAKDDPLKDVKYVYGIGGRFNIDDREKINIRADLGFGPSGDYGLYFTFLEAF